MYRALIGRITLFSPLPPSEHDKEAKAVSCNANRPELPFAD
jgi:hypothetical protein